MTWQWFARSEAAAPGPASPGGGRGASMTAPSRSATTTLWPTPWPTPAWCGRTWAPSLCVKPQTQTPPPRCPRRFTSALTVSWSLILAPQHYVITLLHLSSFQHVAYFSASNWTGDPGEADLCERGEVSDGDLSGHGGLPPSRDYLVDWNQTIVPRANSKWTLDKHS